MDMLFKRYSNPFPLLDCMILSGGFSTFVSSFMAAVREEENEKTAWEYYLHKVYSGSFNDFMDSMKSESDHKAMEKGAIEATVKNSMNILNNFKPI